MYGLTTIFIMTLVINNVHYAVSSFQQAQETLQKHIKEINTKNKTNIDMYSFITEKENSISVIEDGEKSGNKNFLALKIQGQSLVAEVFDKKLGNFVDWLLDQEIENNPYLNKAYQTEKIKLNEVLYFGSRTIKQFELV